MALSKKRKTNKLNHKIHSFLGRRPHRSFKLTRKRDYSRSLDIPGLWKFTGSVNRMIINNKKIFLSLIVFYVAANILMVGMSSQDNYSSIVDVLKSTGNEFSSSLGNVTSAGLLLVATITGGFSQNLSDVQQVYLGIIIILTWLTSVWILRNLIAGKKVKFRDGLYNAGSPIVSVFLIFFVILIQMMPIALAVIGYGAAYTSGLLEGGVEAMLFWVVAVLLSLISIYLITGTFFALIIATLPGMYPMKAISAAGDLVVGRRLRIIGRLVWMFLVVLFYWLIVMIPLILFDSWLKVAIESIEWLPIVPFSILALSGLTVVWVSTYLYMLYREIIKDDAKPVP